MSSTLTLPVAALVSVLAWVLPDVESLQLWGGLSATLATAYLIMELNNRNALLRIRSRMMSVTFLFLMTVCPALHSWSTASLLPLLLVLGFFALFGSYQAANAPGYVFHAFLCLGVGSLLFPPFAVLALCYYGCMAFLLHNFTWRTILAGLIGLALPYWGYAAYAIWENQLDTAFLFVQPWLQLRVPQYSVLGIHEWASLGTIAFFAVLAIIHLCRTAYADKIRTRLLLLTILVTEVFLVAGIALLPEQFDVQFRLFLTNSALLIAHYYALSNGRFIDPWFNLSATAVAVLGIYNYFF